MSEVGAMFDVGGVVLKQPFKIRRLGHVVLQVADLGRSLLFYTQALGSRLAPVVMSGRRANGKESERLKRRSPIR